MELSGRICGGVVILDHPVSLADGTRVRIVLEQNDAAKAVAVEPGHSLSDMLMSFAGTVNDLPDDAAEQHDHYLYGTPKRNGARKQ